MNGNCIKIAEKIVLSFRNIGMESRIPFKLVLGVVRIVAHSTKNSSYEQTHEKPSLLFP